MSQLSAWTGGLVGERDAAQPLLTLYDGPARVELSGATTANWVAKSANLLVDGLGGPATVGLLLPLHWQGVALLLAGVATGATVSVVDEPAALAGCDVAFTVERCAATALDAGVDEVLALSGHPLGAPCAALPPMVQDFAREVPSYGDHWGGPGPRAADVHVAGRPLGALPEPGLGADDRLLISTRLADADGLGVLLAALRAGASLVLVPDPTAVDLVQVARDEAVTATYGLVVAGLPRLSPSGAPS
jgi:uncharacterized protein (TIGR03089 family)